MLFCSLGAGLYQLPFFAATSVAPRFYWMLTRPNPDAKPAKNQRHKPINTLLFHHIIVTEQKVIR